MRTDILAALRTAGITLSLDGDNLVATPKAAITDELRSLIRTHKAELLEALARPDPLPRFPRGLGGYATPPGVPPLGDCELARQVRSMPEDDHVPGVAEDLNDPAAAVLWWRISILEPGGWTIEVDTPSGWTLGEWAAYAERYHGPGCTVTPIAQVPKARAPVNLDEVLAGACEVLEGITPQVFRSLLSPEDLADIEAGGIPVETLRAYAQSFAEGVRSGRIVVPVGEP